MRVGNEMFIYEDYENWFKRYRDDMSRVLEEIGTPFGAVVEEEVSDDFGFGITIERGDGRILAVTLSMVDSGDADDDIPGFRGNFIFRTSDDHDAHTSYGPDNYTDACWADYGDVDAWQAKLADVRSQIGRYISFIEDWKAAATPKPGAGRR